MDRMTLSALAGFFLFFITMPLVEHLWMMELRGAWRKRLEIIEGLSFPKLFRPGIKTHLGIINHLLRLGAGVWPVRILYGWWNDCGYGSHYLPFWVFLIGIISFSILAGRLVFESRILSIYLSVLLLLGSFSMLFIRGKAHRRLFQDQFPAILDGLADSLEAGFSLPQAIQFLVPTLSDPGASEMNRIITQIKIGYSVGQALSDLYQRYPYHDVKLFVEGMNLQHQTGGNMVEMVREIADMVRDRVELNKEILTMTAQGRLSAIVIALLVPVSLGILSLFPGYTDVLFETPIGNLILICAGILELIGAFIVIRMIKIKV